MTTGWFGDGEGSLAGLQTLEACFEIKEKAGPALKKKERERRAAPKEEEVGIGCGPFSSISNSSIFPTYILFPFLALHCGKRPRGGFSIGPKFDNQPKPATYIVNKPSLQV